MRFLNRLGHWAIVCGAKLKSLWDYVRTWSRLSLTREGWYFLVVMGFLAGGAWRQQINLLVVLFGMMLGALILNIWLAGNMLRTLRVRRRTRRELTAGEPVVFEFIAANRREKGAAWAIEVEDTVARAGEPQSHCLRPRVAFARLPAQSKRTACSRGTITRRGRYQLGPISVASEYPFGLVRYRIQQGEKHPPELIVYPKFGVLSSAWRQRNHSRAQADLSRSQLVGAGSGDFHSLRNWRSGDSRRWIHWRTTARQNQLMVRQFERQQERDLCILLDLWRPETGEPWQEEAVEQAVSFAATLCHKQCVQRRSELYLGIAAREFGFVRGLTSEGLLPQVLRELAIAEASDTSRLEEFLRGQRLRLPADAELIVVSACRPAGGIAEVSGRFPYAWHLVVEEGDLAPYFEIDYAS